MHAQMLALQRDLKRQKKLINKLIFSLVAIILLLITFLMSSFRENDQYKVLRAKGIVIVDDQGKERILIGSTTPDAKNRVRTDTSKVRSLWGKRYPNADQYMKYYKDYNHNTDGIVFLDENGFDRVAIGSSVLDPNVGKRIGPQAGMVFCDEQGNERGGIGILHVNGKNRVIMALDGENGMDATGISVLEDGETGFFAGGSNGRYVFMGSAPSESYTKDPLFGMVIGKKEKVQYQVNALSLEENAKNK